MSDLWADLVHFYDVPWNLYKCPRTPPVIHRERLIQSIRSALLERLSNEEEETLSKQNELSECTVDPISVQLGNDIFSGVAVCAEFTVGSTFRFIHYNNPTKKVSLLLVRGSLGSHSLTDSFFEMVGISGYQMLSLASSLLSSQLECYLESLLSHCRSQREKHLDSFIFHTIGKLDITVAAEAPVAPNLKSLQVSVPATNVWTWLSNMDGRGMFVIRLTDCIESMTGMKLGLVSSQVGEKRGHVAIDDQQIPMAISEVSCAGFKLSKAGRLTLKKGPMNCAEDNQTRDGMGNVHAILIGAILDAAND